MMLTYTGFVVRPLLYGAYTNYISLLEHGKNGSSLVMSQSTKSDICRFT